MLSDGSSGREDRTTILVATARAARQWEAALAADRIASRTAAWLTPAVWGLGAWTEQLWLEAPGSRLPPLTPAQASALWRRAIRESEAGADLVGYTGAAEWAAGAWDLLSSWRIEPDTLRANGEDRDYRAFLDWCARYRAALAANGWTDRAQLPAALLDGPLPRLPAEIVLAELDAPPPALRALLERVAAAGTRIVEWRAPPQNLRARRVRLGDAAGELAAAAAWCRARLERDPSERLAVVVTGLAERRGEVARALAELDDGAAGPLGALPSIGAAVAAIELLTARATFETLSRWLRSPFFGPPAGGELAARAMLEVDLRREVAAKAPFLAAYRQGGLAEQLRRKAPTVADALAGALAEVEAIRRATPSGWARLWQRALTALGWRPPGGSSDPGWLGWQTALDELGRLTPILGDVEPEQALDELERVLDRPQSAATPLAGVHVLAHVDDVGPGYAAAWVTGFTDTSWPEPQRANPLLPRTLQRAHGMPWCTPQDAAARSARSLDRLLRFVPEVIISWPGRAYDYETEPSPAIAAWPDVPDAEIDTPRAAPASQRARESLADPAPPLRGDRIHGGAGVLGREARCPLRAFCEDRLRAYPVERVARGLGPRDRGIVVHRALELLLSGQPEQSAFGALRASVGRCAEAALARLFGAARPPLRALFDLERERLETLLAELLELDALRAPFRVAAVEQKRDMRIGEWTLRVRFDRIDELADGRVAIIDYKTGARMAITDWTQDRPRDVQVPLYAAHWPQPVAAAALARVSGTGVGYAGFWEEGALPGQPRRLPAGRTWAQQLEVWRTQMAALAAEHAAGDTRIFLDDTDLAEGAYAPLTRLAEQLALRRGSLSPW
jgi:ATP-dependent helicase/nuclease subunit B